MRIRQNQCPDCGCTLNEQGDCSWCGYVELDPLYVAGVLFEPVEMDFETYRALAREIRELTALRSQTVHG